MKRFLTPQIFLVLTFLAMIVSIPTLQVAIEAGRGEKPLALNVFQRKPTDANLRAYEKNLEEANWFARKLRPLTQYAQFAWFKHGGQKAVVGCDGWLFYKPGVDYLTDNTSASVRPGEDPVKAIINFRDQLASRGIRLLVLPVPNKESIYPEKLTRRTGVQTVVFSPHTDEIMRRLKAAHVEIFDLFKSFEEAKAKAQLLDRRMYLAQDSHWSPEGLEWAAKAVAEHILRKGWIEMGTIDYETKAVAVERTGDILRMLQVPMLEASIPLEQITCHQVFRRNSDMHYQDDPKAEVLILGDSFFRIFQTDEPGAAGFIAHLAKELKQPLASLVSDGGASTLVRQNLYRNPALLANKKLVIWQFVERDIRLGTEGWQEVPLPASTLTTAPREMKPE